MVLIGKICSGKGHIMLHQLGHPHFFSLFKDVRPTQIFAFFLKKKVTQNVSNVLPHRFLGFFPIFA